MTESNYIQRLAFDMDGVLANFCLAYGNALFRATRKDLLPYGWYKDPDYPSVWDWDVEAGYSRGEINATWEKEVLSSLTFWRELEPFPTTKDIIRQVNRLSVEGREVYFITNRAGRKVQRQTEEWLQDQGVKFPTVIIAGDKAPILRALKIDFFIDDKWENVRGADPHPHYYILDAPYNRLGMEVPRVGSVKEAMENAGIWKDAPTRNKKRKGDPTQEAPERGEEGIFDQRTGEEPI